MNFFSVPYLYVFAEMLHFLECMKILFSVGLFRVVQGFVLMFLCFYIQSPNLVVVMFCRES